MGTGLRQLRRLCNAHGDHPHQQGHHVRRHQLREDQGPPRGEQLPDGRENAEAGLYSPRRGIRHRNWEDPAAQGPARRLSRMDLSLLVSNGRVLTAGSSSGLPGLDQSLVLVGRVRAGRDAGTDRRMERRRQSGEISPNL